MSGVDQLQYLSWVLYLAIFVLVLVRTLRRPTPAHLDMTLFFGAIAIVVETSLTSKLQILNSTWVTEKLAPVVALALGYLLLRLVRDFSDVPRMLIRTVEAGMLMLIVTVALVAPPLPEFLALGLVAYLVLVISYDAWAFARHALRTQGVTRRRMQAAAIATVCVVLALLVVGIGIAQPDLTGLTEEVSAIFGLASGICYFIGFAPPTWLRRAWQEPEIRAFMSGFARLAGLPELRDMIAELERTTADAFGARAARIALWDPDRRILQVPSEDGVELPASLQVVWREQRVALIGRATKADDDWSNLSGAQSAESALLAPITAVERRIGVLVVFASRAPVFANSDLELVQLLADQAAVILESKVLIDESARVRAREESARLKEDFLSSAAHDLKTPLTGIVTQAQVMRRRAERDPTAPADRTGLDRLLEQSARLKQLVLELLDVSRLEQGSLIGEREDVDLAGLVRALAQHESSRWKRVHIRATEPILASIDPTRFEQVVNNLIENALKYSPQQTPVLVDIWRDGSEARLSVHDEGIGIPTEDQPLVFERFHRARNVDDRKFAGMGLGLYIARGIVEQHGGRIWVESAPGAGSTFFVGMPAVDPAALASVIQESA